MNKTEIYYIMMIVVTIIDTDKGGNRIPEVYKYFLSHIPCYGSVHIGMRNGVVTLTCYFQMDS